MANTFTTSEEILAWVPAIVAEEIAGAKVLMIAEFPRFVAVKNRKRFDIIDQGTEDSPACFVTQVKNEAEMTQQLISRAKAQAINALPAPAPLPSLRPDQSRRHDRNRKVRLRATHASKLERKDRVSV